ncbi:uncharacterized protein RJT20DRAFT_126846 [Scheffersomyces xylosifermentans]|uniref:uncharacterized protein n=1 Tax=Scheffersomyces xylosifermentans TaxID=1304137 RepID=UPI00315D5478
MFSQSGTNTPISSGFNAVQYHEQLGETVTWIKDWYTPNLSNTSSDDAIAESVKLKGWFKTNINHKNTASLNANPHDTLDLNEWKYYKDVPITDHSNRSPSSVSNFVKDEEESKGMVSNKELESAIKFSSEEGQISGLG